MRATVSDHLPSCSKNIFLCFRCRCLLRLLFLLFSSEESEVAPLRVTGRLCLFLFFLLLLLFFLLFFPRDLFFLRRLFLSFFLVFSSCFCSFCQILSTHLATWSSSMLRLRMSPSGLKYWHSSRLSVVLITSVSFHGRALTTLKVTTRKAVKSQTAIILGSVMSDRTRGHILTVDSGPDLIYKTGSDDRPCLRSSSLIGSKWSITEV